MTPLSSAMARIGRTAAFALVVATGGLTAGGAQSATYEDVNIGGVNLNYYCSKTYGSQFKSVLIGRTAGDWTCEQSAGNRRPIFVSKACALQYRKSGLKARALNWSDPLSWRCFERREVPVHKGVNLTNYCRKTHGDRFKAVLIGRTAGDWTCEQSAGNRRPIFVTKACKLQYGSRVKQAKALDWNNPHSWVCVL